MADVWATKNGNWSDVTVWNTGALPTTADDVYADGRTVYIDINAQVLSISNGTRSGGTINGRFIGNSEVSLSANVFCRDGNGNTVTACLDLLSAAPSTFTVFGNVQGSIGGSNGRAIRITDSTTLTVFGNVSGGVASGNSWGIDNQSTGTVNVIGEVRALNTLNAGAILNGSTGTVNVTGNVFGSSTGSNNRGINNSGNGFVNVRGDILATVNNNPGILNSSGGLVTIVGNVSGGANGTITNNSTGTISITGNAATVTGTVFSNSGAGGTINILGNLTSSTFTAGNQTGTGSVTNIVGNIRGGSLAGIPAFSNSATTGTVNVTGNLFAGSSSGCNGITNSGFVNIFGDVYGGTSGGSPAGVVNSGATSIANIRGNCFSVTSGPGVNNNSTGTVNITGSIFTLGNSTALSNGAGGTVNVFGSVFSTLAVGANNNSTGTIIITGDVFGGNSTNSYGIQNASTGTVVVSGRAIGGIGSAAFGAFNNSTGILRVKRAVGNGWGLGYTTAVASVPGVFSNVQGSQTFVEELECGPRGQWPTGGVIFFTPNTKATSIFETDTFQNYSLIQSNSADNLVPPVSSVRQGTTYNLGLSTGTCIIPPTSSVALNTLVDNLTGTAVLTPLTTWNYPITASDINSIGGRLRNALNANSAENLINSFSS